MFFPPPAVLTKRNTTSSQSSRMSSTSHILSNDHPAHHLPSVQCFEILKTLEWSLTIQFQSLCIVWSSFHMPNQGLWKCLELGSLFSPWNFMVLFIPRLHCFVLDLSKFLSGTVFFIMFSWLPIFQSKSDLVLSLNSLQNMEFLKAYASSIVWKCS